MHAMHPMCMDNHARKHGAVAFYCCNKEPRFHFSHNEAETRERVDGVEYIFMSRDEMEQDIQNNRCDLRTIFFTLVSKDGSN